MDISWLGNVNHYRLDQNSPGHHTRGRRTGCREGSIGMGRRNDLQLNSTKVRREGARSSGPYLLTLNMLRRQAGHTPSFPPPGRRRLLGSAPRSPQVQGPSEQFSQSPSNRITSGVGRMTHTKQGLDLTVSSFQRTQLPCKH